jgi:hypothetical protein
MPNLRVAHVREQGIDLIITPLNHVFGHQPRSEQLATVDEIQFRSRQAGLAGTVIPVWDNGGGRMGFIAPAAWHSFFRSLDLHSVNRSINRELAW